MKLDARHRWTFFLDGPFRQNTGYFYAASHALFYCASYRCRACGKVVRT